DRADTAGDVRAWSDQVKPVSNAGEVALPARSEVAAILRQTRCDVLGHPKLKLGRGHDIGGVGKYGCIVEIVEQAPQVIRWGMCQNDVSDRLTHRLTVDAGVIHIVGELSGTWHVVWPSANIDQHGLARSAHKRNIAWR